MDYDHPVRVKRGFKDDEEPQSHEPDEAGNTAVEIEEVERIEIHLAPDTQHLAPKKAPSYRYMGYLVTDETLKPLPIGSTLDAVRGVFYWSPGPGFVGDYELIFIDTLRNRLKRINIRIQPKYSLE